MHRLCDWINTVEIYITIWMISHLVHHIIDVIEIVIISFISSTVCVWYQLFLNKHRCKKKFNLLVCFRKNNGWGREKIFICICIDCVISIEIFVFCCCCCCCCGGSLIKFLFYFWHNLLRIGCFMFCLLSQFSSSKKLVMKIIEVLK